MHLYKRKRFRGYRALVLSALVFAALAVGFVLLVGQTQSRGSDEQFTLLKNALRTAAANCYAVEGRYPPTIDYLVDRYGVVIDQDRFLVSYNAFAENLMPDIRVLEIGKEHVENADGQE